ncbi:MAG: FKBP-type peptidyl-prolyl cis-trans isomerase [Gammaproteobacteria bacterium]|nr:FKBP-type peptidyl-prolyl cis-trans isomerase [Gammaproteobacteria bacterium]
MKRLLLPTLALSIGLMPTTYAALKSADKMSDAEKQSYAAGYAQGGQLQKMDTELNVKFNMEYFQQGFDDAYKSAKSVLTEEQMEQSLVALQKSIMEKQRSYLETQFSKNKTAGEEFMKTQAKNKDVKKLSNGILYEVVKSGTSTTHPTLKDKVKVSYIGKTIDGKEFDKNNDIELGLNSLIKGWQIALQKMTPGDQWKLYIPSDQAYGTNGAPGIMPNSALVFDIELKDIVKDNKAGVAKKS